MAEEVNEGGVLGFLKKIGLPGIIAAIVSAVVTMIPFLFQLDERYAKADDLEARMVTVSKQINDLTIEVGRLAGTQQVMVAIMSAKPEVKIAAAPIEPAAAPVPTPVPAPIVKSSSAPVLSPLPVVPAQPPISTAVPKTAEEKKVRLDEVSRALEHTQQRVQQIQKY
jgi:hypothetical protein